MQRLETTLRIVLNRDSLCNSGFDFVCDCPKEDDEDEEESDDENANGDAVDGVNDEEDEEERGISGEVLRAR